MKWFNRILYKVCWSCRPHRSRTIRFAYSLVALALITASLAAVSSSDESSIRLSTTRSTLDQKEVFAVDVYVTAGQPVNAVNIALRYPEDKLEVFSIDTGQSVITIWTEEPYAANSRVYFSGGTFRRGFLGEHLIGTVNFLPKQTGTFEFTADDIRLLAGDGSGSAVTVSDASINSVTVQVRNNDDGTTSIDTDVQIRISTDITGDGKVTLNDISRFMAAWADKSIVYDFNNDRKMTFTDFAIILSDSFFK